MRKWIFKLVRAYMRHFGMLPGENLATRKFPNGYNGELNDEYLASLEALA